MLDSSAALAAALVGIWLLKALRTGVIALREGLLDVPDELVELVALTLGLTLERLGISLRWHGLALVVLGHVYGLQQFVDSSFRMLDVLIDLRLQLLSPLQKERHIEEFITGWSVGRVDLQHDLDEVREVLAVVLSDLGVGSLVDSLEQTLHVFGLEGRIEGNELVDDAAQAPDV